MTHGQGWFIDENGKRVYRMHSPLECQGSPCDFHRGQQASSGFNDPSPQSSGRMENPHAASAAAAVLNVICVVALVILVPVVIAIGPSICALLEAFFKWTDHYASYILALLFVGAVVWASGSLCKEQARANPVKFWTTLFVIVLIAVMVLGVGVPVARWNIELRWANTPGAIVESQGTTIWMRWDGHHWKQEVMPSVGVVPTDKGVIIHYKTFGGWKRKEDAKKEFSKGIELFDPPPVPSVALK